MKKLLVLLSVMALLSGALPASLQAAAWEKILPGRWMLWAGGGVEIWDFREDGTCVASWSDLEEEEISHSSAHTWRVEPATEQDLQKLWAQPAAVLVIDGEERYGLHFEGEHARETLDILEGSIITEEEKALTAALPLCISITFWEGGGGYVRMKDQ